MYSTAATAVAFLPQFAAAPAMAGRLEYVALSPAVLYVPHQNSPSPIRMNALHHATRAGVSNLSQSTPIHFRGQLPCPASHDTYVYQSGLKLFVPSATMRRLHHDTTAGQGPTSRLRFRVWQHARKNKSRQGRLA